MIAKHTPGPWTLATRHSDIPGFLIQPPDQDAHCVAIVPHNRRCKTEAEANARLMVAAPELLEALKMARECIAYCRRAHKDAQSGEGVPVEVFLDAAIAKATGATNATS